MFGPWLWKDGWQKESACNTYQVVGFNNILIMRNTVYNILYILCGKEGFYVGPDYQAAKIKVVHILEAWMVTYDKADPYIA